VGTTLLEVPCRHVEFTPPLGQIREKMGVKQFWRNGRAGLKEPGGRLVRPLGQRRREVPYYPAHNFLIGNLGEVMASFATDPVRYETLKFGGMNAVSLSERIDEVAIGARPQHEMSGHSDRAKVHASAPGERQHHHRKSDGDSFALLKYGVKVGVHRVVVLFGIRSEPEIAIDESEGGVDGGLGKTISPTVESLSFSFDVDGCRGPPRHKVEKSVLKANRPWLGEELMEHEARSHSGRVTDGGQARTSAPWTPRPTGR